MVSNLYTILHLDLYLLVHMYMRYMKNVKLIFSLLFLYTIYILCKVPVCMIPSNKIKLYLLFIEIFKT